MAYHTVPYLPDYYPNHPYYKMLEDDLADLSDKEAALVFNSAIMPISEFCLL